MHYLLVEVDRGIIDVANFRARSLALFAVNLFCILKKVGVQKYAGETGNEAT